MNPLAWLVARGAVSRLDPAPDPRLVRVVEVYVEAHCPCGSTHLHRLSLVSTSDCARCGRTIGVRSITYVRTPGNTLPEPLVAVDYVG